MYIMRKKGLKNLTLTGHLKARETKENTANLPNELVEMVSRTGIAKKIY